MVNRSKLKKFFLWVLLLLVELTLFTLGTWQLERLRYKTQFITQINNRSSAPVITALASPIEYYRQVELAGRFISHKKIYIYNLNEQGKPGYDIIIPFQLLSGEIVLASYGWVVDKNSQVVLPALLKGMIMPITNKGYFVPHNDLINNQWYHINMSDLEQYTDLKLLPVQIICNRNPDKLPIYIRNDHLGYALVWYALAIIGLVVIAIKIKS